MHRALYRLVALSMSLAVLACERSRTPPPAADTATPPAPPPPPAVVQPSPPPSPPPSPLARETWDTDAGPVLVVRGRTRSSGQVIAPRSAGGTLPDISGVGDAAAQGAVLDLFGRAGLVGEARLGAVLAPARSNAGGCIGWPSAPVRPAEGAQPLPTWSVAFTAGRATAIALDSLETLPPPDSARLAAAVTRLASLLPNDTVQAFRGVPFSVRAAYRFSPAPGAGAVVAMIERQLNQEANPLEQQIVLVAERDGTDPGASYRTVYFERRAGSEERLEVTDVLAAVALGAAHRPALVLLREGPEHNSYALLERSAAGQWDVRWTSGGAGMSCGL